MSRVCLLHGVLHTPPFVLYAARLAAMHAARYPLRAACCRWKEEIAAQRMNEMQEVRASASRRTRRAKQPVGGTDGRSRASARAMHATRSLH